MKFFKAFCLVSMLFAVAYGSQSNSLSNSWKPSEWLSLSELEQLPAMNEISLDQIEKMTARDGAILANKMYHLSQVNPEFEPTFLPKPSDVSVYIYSPNAPRVECTMEDFVKVAYQQPNFGSDEVTFFITGLPNSSETVAKANRALIQAYMQRYNNLQNPQNLGKYQSGSQAERDSSEEKYGNSKANPEGRPVSYLVVIDLGSTIESYVRFATLDVERSGTMFGRMLVKVTDEMNVPTETIHILAQGVAAHVAGAAAREYRRMTGHQLRRITALDPSKIYARHSNVLTGLARGDADFVDVIHTSAYGMGTTARVGDVDFYPNGPSVAVPGADNLVEATMRATRYFAESVRPGNERNFPAVVANSLEDYRKQNGSGKRGYMGIATNFDLEGDFILTVNPKSPFGRNAPAQKQTPYHNIHAAWNQNA